MGLSTNSSLRKNFPYVCQKKQRAVRSLGAVRKKRGFQKTTRRQRKDKEGGNGRKVSKPQNSGDGPSNRKQKNQERQ
jgi:hypothetical protein